MRTRNREQRRKEFDKWSTLRNDRLGEAATIAGFMRGLIMEEARLHWKVEPGTLVLSDHYGPYVGSNTKEGVVRIAEEYKVVQVEEDRAIIEYGARPCVTAVKRTKGGHWSKRPRRLWQYWSRAVDDRGTEG